MSNRWRGIMCYVGPLIALALIASAGLVLWRMLSSISYAEVELALVNMEPWRLAAAFVCTLAGVLALSCYDILALKVVRSQPPISLRRAAAGSAIANIFANCLGFPLLSGGSIRYRIYSMAGASLSVVGRVVVMSWVTMWSGILLVFGVFLVIPHSDEPVIYHHIIDQGTGVILLCGLTVFILWVGRKRRTIRLGGWTIRLPGAGVACGMVLAGAVDLLTAAGALWVLLPVDVAPDLGRYMVTYTIGLIAGIVANTPGGIGVFEAAIVTGLQITDRADVAAALIVFRLIYFLFPLLVAVTLVGLFEVWHRRVVKEAGRF